MKDISISFLSLFPDFLFLFSFLYLFFLFLCLLLFLNHVTILHKFVIHFVINKTIKHRSSNKITSLRGLVFQTSYHLNLNLNWLWSFEPFGSHLLVSNTFKESLIFHLIFLKRFDLSYCRLRHPFIR